jgi:uncharacterized Zn finger protein (UPF0148 family)
MMGRELRAGARCGNDGCPRVPEPGDAYCAACGLERTLFRRDERRREAAPGPAPGAEAGRH